MAINKDDLINALAEMSQMELDDSMKNMEEKFGVTAVAMTKVAPVVVDSVKDENDVKKPI